MSLDVKLRRAASLWIEASITEMQIEMLIGYYYVRLQNKYKEAGKRGEANSSLYSLLPVTMETEHAKEAADLLSEVPRPRRHFPYINAPWMDVDTFSDKGRAARAGRCPDVAQMSPPRLAGLIFPSCRINVPPS